MNMVACPRPQSSCDRGAQHDIGLNHSGARSIITEKHEHFSGHRVHNRGIASGGRLKPLEFRLRVLSKSVGAAELCF